MPARSCGARTELEQPARVGRVGGTDTYSEGTRLVKRFGYGSKAETETAALASAELLGLAAWRFA